MIRTFELSDRVPFAAQLISVDEAPEPLRGAMRKELKPPNAIQWLIYGPAQKMVGRASPASLLAILQHEWIVATCDDGFELEVYRCDFADTLLMEITDILLYGQLRLDFIQDGRAQSVAVQFNTVTDDLYRKAVQILLNGIDEVPQDARNNSVRFRDPFEELPLKFKNGMLRYLSTDQQVLGFAHWPTAQHRKFKILWRELVPEGVLVLANRQLLFISEENDSWRTQSKYGYVVTYELYAEVGDGMKG